MGDLGLVEAFVGGARSGSVPGLQVTGDVLYVAGWWHAALRVAKDTFIVRAEPPPEPVPVFDLLTVDLERLGLHEVEGGDNPLINAVTYVEADVSGLEWRLWAPSAERGAEAIAQRAGAESAPPSGEAAVFDLVNWNAPSERLTENLPGNYGDVSAEFAEAFLDGMPTPVVVAVGLPDDVVTDLRALLPACRVELQRMDEALSACGLLKPDLVLVDTAAERGRHFVLELRGEACGRSIPIAAVTTEPVPPGANVTLDPGAGPMDWHDQLVELLP